MNATIEIVEARPELLLRAGNRKASEYLWALITSPPASARTCSIYNSRSVNPVVASNIEIFVGVA